MSAITDSWGLGGYGVCWEHYSPCMAQMRVLHGAMHIAWWHGHASMAGMPQCQHAAMEQCRPSVSC